MKAIDSASGLLIHCGHIYQFALPIYAIAAVIRAGDMSNRCYDEFHPGTTGFAVCPAEVPILERKRVFDWFPNIYAIDARDV